MPKYVCPLCSRVLIRTPSELQVMGLKSYCDEQGKHVLLKRLRIKPKPKG